METYVAFTGTCTIAIAMLTTVPLRYIPPIPPGTFFPESDRSTFEILSLAAQQVKGMCVDGSGNGVAAWNDNFVVTLPGWMTGGRLTLASGISASMILTVVKVREMRLECLSLIRGRTCGGL